jgi:hypothetical protein
MSLENDDHIAQHLHSFAMKAIPWEDNGDYRASDSNADLESRVQPSGRAELMPTTVRSTSPADRAPATGTADLDIHPTTSTAPVKELHIFPSQSGTVPSPEMGSSSRNAGNVVALLPQEGTVEMDIDPEPRKTIQDNESRKFGISQRLRTYLKQHSIVRLSPIQLARKSLR